jgi:hypothetical protein
MPREEYDYLTDATRDVLTDNVKAAKNGWDKCSQYIYQILSGEKRDFYAGFRSMYQGMCNGGVSTARWDEDLAYIRERADANRNHREVTEAFSDKFKGNNQLFETYLAKIADGKLTLSELDELEPLVEIEDGLLRVLKKAMRAHRIKLEKTKQ